MFLLNLHVHFHEFNKLRLEENSVNTFLGNDHLTHS